MGNLKCYGHIIKFVGMIMLRMPKVERTYFNFHEELILQDGPE